MTGVEESKKSTVIAEQLEFAVGVNADGVKADLLSPPIYDAQETTRILRKVDY
jgi:hypothetical protein